MSESLPLERATNGAHDEGEFPMTDRARSRATARARRAVRSCLVAAPLAAVAATACQTTPPTPPPGGPAGTAVVFDIDGTLTQSELSSTPHAGAAAAVQAYVDKGYEVVYVTARWDALQRASTESWLDDNGFPDLPLFMAPSLLVTDSAKVDYKTDTLGEIESTTGPVTFAYGDSSSDFDAYANVGAPVSGVFALRRAGDSACQPGAWAACLPDYTAHLSTIAGLPDAP